MSFWFRYSVLILLCIVTPLGLGFWLDTQSQLERARAAGEAGAMSAEPALSAQLALDAHKRAGLALQLAQSIGDEKLLVPVKGALKPEAAARLQALLGEDDVVSDTGFAWVIDETGLVVARRGSAREQDPPAITGLPLFVATQQGFALDGTMRLGDALFVVGAAPVVKDGEAAGAVFVARAADGSLVTSLAGTIRAEVSLVQKGEIVASTLPTDIATAVVAKLEPAGAGPSHGGRLDSPLTGAEDGLLPLFVPHDMDGTAYSSLALAMLGQEDARWVISVENGRALAHLGERQQSIIGILVAALLLAVVIGLSIARTFVRPIGQLTDHLSSLQQGRGEREISENQVSRPFRRLAKLINMTVQRIPPGGVFSTFDTGERRPSADPPQSADLGAAMLSAAPPPEGAPGVPPSFTGSAPLNVSTLGGTAGPRAASTGLRPGDRLGNGPERPSTERAPLERPATLADPLPPVGPAPAFRAPSFTPRSEAALAEAAAADLMSAPEALDQAFARALDAPEVDPAPASRKPRSASSIRGAPSTAVSQSMLDMNTSALQALGGARPDSVRGPALADRGPFGQPAPAPFGAPTPFGADPSPAAPFANLGDEGRAPSGGFAIPAASTSRSGGSAALGGGGPSFGGSGASFGGGGPSFGGSGAAFGSAGVPDEDDAHSDDFRSEATVVSAPNDYLLQASARDMTASGFAVGGAPDRTVVAEVPKNLLLESKKPSGDYDDPEDMAHFKETYERFVEMRRQCGEPTGDLVFERFLTKLRKNREQLISKYNCRTVRFQVYEKDGKAALKATPVRA